MTETVSERILVVDDSKTQLFAIAMLLQKEGYKVDRYFDPIQARDALDQTEFDLLLCDLIMPEFDGMAMLRFARSRHPLMPVIIMTAFGDRESGIEALKQGAEDYIFKASGDRERDEFFIRIRRALEKAKLQRDIYAYQNHLEQKVDERTRELKETQDKLVQSERLRSLGVITTGVAHDFNNILGVILGRTQLLLRKAHDQKFGKDLEIIEKAALKGSATIKRMQDYTRIRKDEVFKPVQMNAIIDEVVEITETRWKDESEKRGIRIDIVKDCQDVPFVSGNASELKDVLINVIFNSIEAMPKGGRLEIKTYQESIDNEIWVTTEISDTGSGMPEAVQNRVFDPFFTTKEQGTGLGMSTAYGIIQRHRGDITFKSAENGGTTFYIKLLGALFLQELPGDDHALAMLSEKKKFFILVVDDDEAVRTTLAEMLEIQEHNIMTAASGKEALDLMTNHQFDIMFTDLGMPGMSGWELSQEAKKISPQTHIIMITGWGSQLDRQKAEQSNVQKVLPKPVSYDEIVRVVGDYSKSLTSRKD